MQNKFLKYGIGILAPVAPEGFDLEHLPACGVDVRAEEGVRIGTYDADPATSETDPIFAAHDAAHRGGTLIVIPAGRKLSQPINLAFGRGWANVRVVAEAGSAARIVEHAPFDAAEKATARLASVELELGEGADITYVSAQDFGMEASDFVRRRAKLGRDASLAWLDFCFGGGFVRSAVTTRLEGENASVKSRGIWFGAGVQRYDVSQEVLHLAPRTRSDVRSRGIVKDAAKAIHRGLARIAKDARGSVARQRADALMLSDKAEASAVPKLEIATDDVKCGHAASAGRIDEEKLFYLMSRGLDRAGAEAAFVEGFLHPLIAELGDAMLEEGLRQAVAERLKP